MQHEQYIRYSKDPGLFRRQAQDKMLSKQVRAIFVDEIQRVPEMLNEIQVLMAHATCQFILTGSSARKLKRGGGNLLAGRAVQRFLFPFIYEEIAESFDLEKILRFGSLPAIHGKSEEGTMDILTAYTQTYLREEIQMEGLVRSLGGFSRFLDIAAAQCGELIDFTGLARQAALTARTVQSYYGILEDTLVGFTLAPWRKSVRKRLTGHPKFYLFDTGVTNSINRRLAAPPDPRLRGRLFEQWLILETHRLASYRRSEARLFYWRTNSGAEVDLLIEKHGVIRAAVEIKASRNVGGGDLSGLRAFHDDQPKVPLYVVAEVEEPYQIDKVRVLPWKMYLTDILKSLL